jgi:hypothetical protein
MPTGIEEVGAHHHPDISSQMCIGLHQSLLADRIMDLHLQLASNTDA